MEKPCQHQQLVENDLCSVTYCPDCGSVDLNLGSMTLHLSGRQLEGLSEAFNKAVARKRTLQQMQGDGELLGDSPSKELH